MSVCYREKRAPSSGAGGRLVCSLCKVLSCVSSGPAQGGTVGVKGGGGGTDWNHVWPLLPAFSVMTWGGDPRGKLGPSCQSHIHLARELAELQAWWLPHASKVGQQGSDGVCEGRLACATFRAERYGHASPVLSKPSECPHIPLVVCADPGPWGGGEIWEM